MDNNLGEIEYKFKHLASKKVESLENKKINDALLKWSMKDRMAIQAFSFDKPFHAYQKQTFFEAFFSDPNVTTKLLTLSPASKWTPLNSTPTTVKAPEISCSCTSMHFFERLYGGEVVRQGGHIIRCEEEYSEVLEHYLDDQLKKMLLSEESEHWALYSEEERKELLLLLLGHLLVGGSLCQMDEQLQAYLDVTKALYRDLIGVHQDKHSQKIVVSSIVYRLSATDHSGAQIYPCEEEHYQNFTYACVDPLKKQVVLLYHRYGFSLPSIL